MRKTWLLAGLLLVPGVAMAQLERATGMLAVSLFNLIRGTSAEKEREYFVSELTANDWLPGRIDRDGMLAEQKPLLKQAFRGTIVLSRRIDAHPDSADLYRRRGLLYSQLSDVRALPDMEKAHILGATHPEMDFQLAHAYLNAGSLTKAQTSAEAYSRRAPTDPRPYKLKAFAEMRRLKGEHADHCRQALPDLNRVLALDSTDFNARMLRGYALATTGQLAPAIADYRRALAVAPQNAQVNFFLAEALLGAGGTTEACQYLLIAAPFAPKTTKAYQKKYCR